MGHVASSTAPGARCCASAFTPPDGFVPSTLGGDGDPLDVLLFLDHGVPPGSIATARLIGVLEIRQRKARHKTQHKRSKAAKEAWARNDRFIAAATHAHDHQDLRTLADLRPHLLDEVEAFFVNYGGLEGKQLEVLDRKGPRRAHKLLKAGSRLFRVKVGAKAEARADK
jgi:inorganic pyrophosphatase